MNPERPWVGHCPACCPHCYETNHICPFKRYQPPKDTINSKEDKK